MYPQFPTLQYSHVRIKMNPTKIEKKMKNHQIKEIKNNNKISRPTNWAAHHCEAISRLLIMEIALYNNIVKPYLVHICPLPRLKLCNISIAITSIISK